MPRNIALEGAHRVSVLGCCIAMFGQILRGSGGEGTWNVGSHLSQRLPGAAAAEGCEPSIIKQTHFACVVDICLYYERRPCEI